MSADTLRWRREPTRADIERVRAMVHSTGFFSADEIAIAAELVETAVNQGSASGYWFEFADRQGECIGYSCFGPIPGTQGSFDLYWIAVAPHCQGQGIGQHLLERSEATMAEHDARRVYIETSARVQYAPTQRFYRARGYQCLATLEDFYAPGDAKLIFGKRLDR